MLTCHGTHSASCTLAEQHAQQPHWLTQGQSPKPRTIGHRLAGLLPGSELATPGSRRQ